jgi:hypothetical protein
MMVYGDAGSPGLPPALLLEQRGLWREAHEPSGTAPREALDALRQQVKHTVEHGSDDDGNAVKDMAPVAMSLFDGLFGPDVQSALKLAREQSNGEPPLLRIHLARAHEGIPWELLHDGEDFLGMTFRIARLPILPNPPEQPDDCTHAVAIVRSLLGKGVAAPTEDDYATWRDTFRDLLPAGVAAELHPEDEPKRDWPRTRVLQEEADILHVTCHGKRDEAGVGYWALDPDGSPSALQFRFNMAQVNSVRTAFKARRPLVFANACAPASTFTEPEHPPLLNELFGLGALNCIGTLAPIRQKLALRFARHFYKSLLGRGSDVSMALFEAKRACRDDPVTRGDPTYLLYCLYGPPDMRYGPTTNGANG